MKSHDKNVVLQTNTHLRHWEHQQGWWTSEQLLWPGGPEVQRQPHPPGGHKHEVKSQRRVRDRQRRRLFLTR